MTLDHLLRRCRYRAWHRGTREADLIVGGYFDRYAPEWTMEQALWFERFMDEADADILAWALDTADVPEAWHGPMMDALKRLDFVPLPR